MRVVDVVQAVVALAIVLGLMWLLARLSRRALGVRGSGVVDVIARHPITRGSAVAVVRVADRTLVIGVTEQNVTLLAEADPDAVEAALLTATRLPAPTSGPLRGSALSPQTWRSTVEALRERTTRRG